MLQNLLGSKATTIIGFALGLLGFIASNGVDILPEAWLGTIGQIVGIATMLFGAVVKNPNKK